MKTSKIREYKTQELIEAIRFAKRATRTIIENIIILGAYKKTVCLKISVIQHSDDSNKEKNL